MRNAHLHEVVLVDGLAIFPIEASLRKPVSIAPATRNGGMLSSAWVSTEREAVNSTGGERGMIAPRTH